MVFLHQHLFQVLIIATLLWILYIPQCRAEERLNILSTTKSRTTSMVQQAQTYRA